jgi:hypothetical protein
MGALPGMTVEELLEHANHVRALVLTQEDKVTPGRTPRTPPAAVYRGNARRRKAWLDRAAIDLARTQRMFGDD